MNTQGCDSNESTSTIPTVSLILFAESGQTDQRIWQAVDALGKRQWRTQVLLVDRGQTGDQPETITYRPIPQRFKSIGEAISGAKHEVIAIADQGIAIDPDQWQFMVNRMDQSPIQSAFSNSLGRPSQLGLFSRILTWFYYVLVRTLVRIGKTEFDRGLTVFKRAEIEPFLLEYRACLDGSNAETEHGSTRESDTFGITQLLAMARLNQRPVLETRTENLEPENPATPVSKKQILISIQNVIRFWWNRVMFPIHQNNLSQKRYKPVEKTVATVGLMLIAAFVLFRCLNFPLYEPDEARNAQLAMNIVNSGQWMSLTLAEENYWDKPPLQLWAIAASYKLLGISQFATRFPVAIASMLTLLTTLLVGQRLVGFRSAWLGTLILLLTSGFVCVSRYVTMDASLTAMATAMTLCGFVAISGPFKKRYALAAGIACGIGVLVKGPVIGVLCLPPLLATFWLSQSHRPLPRRWWLWFAGPAFLIAAPWFVATAMIHPDFVTYFFWKHHVVRFSEAFNHREPIWYYFIGIFIFMFPASYLLPSVTKFLTSRKPEIRLSRTHEQGFLFLSAVWIIGFFSISEAKLPTYIVPSFPPICLLMGVLLNQRLFSRGSSLSNSGALDSGISKRTWLEKVGRRAPVELLVWCVVTSVAMLVFFKPETSSFSTTDFMVGTIVLSVLTVISILYALKPKIAWTCFGLIGLAMVSLIAHSLVPAISKTRSIHLAASEIQSTEEFRNAPVVFFGRETYGASLKLDESNITWFEETQVLSMIEFLKSNPSSIIVSSEDPMETLRRDLPWTVELEERQEARHLYVSRPNPTVVARNRATTVHR